MGLSADHERMIYDTITDDELQTPVADLPAGRVLVIQAVLRGPYADELMERIGGFGIKEEKATHE